MKTKVYLGIGIRIIFLFTVAMMATFLPEYLRGFFGDVNVHDSGSLSDSNWKWGARHYWFAWMMFFLFILSLINLAMAIGNIIQKNYDIK